MAALAGAVAALSAYQRTVDLDVGQVRLSIDPGHRGALDVYVPLVDWGIRYESIRFPARLHVDLRTVDRRAAVRLAQGGSIDVRRVQDEARDAIAAYLRQAIVVTTLGALLLGLLVALAVRGRRGPPLRVTAAVAAGASLLVAVLLVTLLPPRGDLDEPQYYAYGPDIPRALQVLEDLQRSTGVLDQELDQQLVGLARLVSDPASRTPLRDAPHLTIASDLHNNVLATSLLGRVAGSGPLLFVGDLTDRGSAVEAALLRRVVDLGDPFLFVSGNHDSDTLTRSLARRGAIVLTEDGPLDRDGDPPRPRSDADRVVRVDGIRIAGYADPTERRRAEGFRDRYDDAGPTEAQQTAFADWAERLADRADVIMVHQPAMLDVLRERWREDPPRRAPVLVVGHTHRASLEREGPVTIVNGGSIGAGGSGGLAEASAAIGIARLVYRMTDGRFTPLAADLVAVDPGTGSATARRERLDRPADEDEDGAPTTGARSVPAPAD
ncbi:MAG: metallophosphoesterase [Solirubrobacteraceae bacterium]|nr:metallophosphoesterase [Solirubrobacteraceae bacterium]